MLRTYAHGWITFIEWTEGAQQLLLDDFLRRYRRSEEYTTKNEFNLCMVCYKNAATEKYKDLMQSARDKASKFSRNKEDWISSEANIAKTKLDWLTVPNYWVAIVRKWLSPPINTAEVKRRMIKENPDRPVLNLEVLKKTKVRKETGLYIDKNSEAVVHNYENHMMGVHGENWDQVGFSDEQ